MSRRYYRRNNRRYRNYNDSETPLDMVFEMLLMLIIWIAKLIFKMIYELFGLIRDRFYKTRVDKKVSLEIQNEIQQVQPLPEVHFEEKEEEKEVYLPYKKKSFLLTKAEYNFDKVLTEAVKDRYYIGRQVLLSSIVEVTSTYKPYRSKIDKKTIDFVLFNKAGYTPYLAIELDDSSHSRWDRIKRDEFVQDVLNRAGIKLERVKNAYSYNLDEIAKLIS
jgi:hypothetical protein